MLEAESGKIQSAKALRIKKNERKKNLKRPTKSDSTRATAASGKAGARNSPDKEREGVAKGRESATETFAPLIFCMRPCETGFKGVKHLLCIA